MAYTFHGHHIEGTSTENPPDSRARCGGPGLCAVCSRQASVYPKPESDLTRPTTLTDMFNMRVMYKDEVVGEVTSIVEDLNGRGITIKLNDNYKLIKENTNGS